MEEKEQQARILKKSQGYINIIIKDSLEGIYAAAILTKALKNEKRSFGIKWTTKEIKTNEAKHPKLLLSIGVKIAPEYQSIQRCQERITLEEIQEFVEQINPTNDSTAEIVKIYNIATQKEQNGYSVIDILEIKDLPLQKALSMTTHPFMPDIAENEEAAIALCKQAQIQLRLENKIKTLLDLTLEEQTKLLKEIEKKQLTKRVTHNRIIHREKPDQAYLVELCYKKEKRGLALGVLIEDIHAKKEALQLYIQTQKEFIKILRQYQKSQKQESKDAIIIQFQEAKREQQEELLSYLSRMECYPHKTLLVLAPTIEGTTLLLYEGSEAIVQQLLEPIAAKKEKGGYELTQEQEKEFMKSAKERLSQLILQEKI